MRARDVRLARSLPLARRHDRLDQRFRLLTRAAAPGWNSSSRSGHTTRCAWVSRRSGAGTASALATHGGLRLVLAEDCADLRAGPIARRARASWPGAAGFLIRRWLPVAPPV